FAVHGGEIMGIAGLAGNGQDQLLEIFSAQVRPNAGKLVFDDQDITDLPCAARRMLGIHCVPEERLGHAAVPEMSLALNACLTARERQNFVSRYGFLDFTRIESFTKDLVARFNVKTQGIDHQAMSLSGGNLQKFIMGREIMQNPNLLVALQPTWGVDAGSAHAIHQELLNLAKAGAAILVISQDLDELFAIANRIAVICEGVLSETYDTNMLTPESIGLLMSGQEIQSDI
ncbi:MAG: ATP-binding cassette domain-containing protein, partial [Pseudomonadota bacterium]